MSDTFPFGHFFKSTPSNNEINVPIPIINEQGSSNSLISQDSADDQFQFEELEFVNKEIHNFLKNTISTAKYNTFFDNNLFLINIKKDQIDFSVTTSFIKNIIDSHYKTTIEEAVLNVLGKKYTIIVNISEANKNIILNNHSKSNDKTKNINNVKFSIPLDLVPTNDDLESKIESKYLEHINGNEQTSGILIDEQKTFESFIVGPSNNMANATAIAVAKNPGNTGKYPTLYMYSNSGLGKTHLLHAVANGIKSNYPSLVVCLITARDFMQEMIDSIKDNSRSTFQKKYTEKIDVLMIDDIHELKNKKSTQNEFFHVFNELYNKGKQLIFTSDKAPNEIDGIEERIITRLQWGLVIDIQKPDLETRIAILKRKAYELDLFLTDDVLNLIACSAKNSIRELEGSLIKLSAYTDVMNVQIDSEIVKDVLMINDEENTKIITLDNIAKTTSQYFKIPVADLKSKARSKEITSARHIAMYLSHKIIGPTLQEIGRFYGDRDHTSVIHAIKKIKEHLKTDSNLSKDVMLIENNI